MIATGEGIPGLEVSEEVYYNSVTTDKMTQRMRDFHNLYVKKALIQGVSKNGNNLIDFACGKAGDLPKWISAKLSFVFGVDISKDNLENRLDGACARFLKMKKSNKNIPYALFVNGNSSYNIKDGSAMLSDKAKQITSAVFGKGPKEADKIGKGVARQYGRGDEGFNVSSCQFAIHYACESEETFRTFVGNLTTHGKGFFFGTCLDGQAVYSLLLGKTGHIFQSNSQVFGEVKKEYADGDGWSEEFGRQITVKLESFEQAVKEYLVPFGKVIEILGENGYELVKTSTFSDHYAEQNRFTFTGEQQTFSFLHRSFMFRRVEKKEKEEEAVVSIPVLENEEENEEEKKEEEAKDDHMEEAL
jgi:mRNA (guanine-N7-)-methyltransferase